MVPNSKTWGTAIKTNNESRFQTYTHLISCHHVPFISIYTHWTCAHWMVIIYWLDGHNVLDIMSFIYIYTNLYPVISHETMRYVHYRYHQPRLFSNSATWKGRVFENVDGTPGKMLGGNRWKQHLEKNDCEEAFYLFGDYFPFLFHLLSQLNCNSLEVPSHIFRHTKLGELY